MIAPTLVTAAGGPNGFTPSTFVQKPLNPQLGDVLVLSFLMNGTPALPPGFSTLFELTNSNVVLWAVVDGTIITAENDGQAFVFGDGGGALYYQHEIAMVRGCRVGAPFDGPGAGSSLIGGEFTPAVEVTTTQLDALLILFTHTLFSSVHAIGVTSPLTLFDAAEVDNHAASGVQAVPGPSGSQTMHLDGNGQFMYANLVALAGLPSGDGLVDVTGTEGGRKRWGGRK